jgi:hypothetical protein
MKRAWKHIYVNYVKSAKKRMLQKGKKEKIQAMVGFL